MVNVTRDQYPFSCIYKYIFIYIIHKHTTHKHSEQLRNKYIIIIKDIKHEFSADQLFSSFLHIRVHQCLLLTKHTCPVSSPFLHLYPRPPWSPSMEDPYRSRTRMGLESFPISYRAWTWNTSSSVTITWSHISSSSVLFR